MQAYCIVLQYRQYRRESEEHVSKEQFAQIEGPSSKRKMGGFLKDPMASLFRLELIVPKRYLRDRRTVSVYCQN